MKKCTTAEELMNVVDDIVHPEYMGENKGVGCRVGQCRCGNLVRSYHKFCNECGVKLEWGDVWPDEHKAGKSSEQTKRRKDHEQE